MKLSIRKLLLLSCLLLLLLPACQNHEDPVAPADRPDARLAKVLAEYKTLLTGAPYGWKAELRTNAGELYNFLFTFRPEDRVTMASDINGATATPLESTYRLKAMQHPALLFDTYSHLHILADPDPAKNGGVAGEGRFSDFEFDFSSVTDQTITLKGQRFGSQLVLTKATQAEAATFITDLVAQAQALANLSTFTTYFKRFSVGTQAFDVQVDMAGRTLVFTYFIGEEARTFSTTFYFSGQGLVLTQPFTQGGLNISLLRNLVFNATTRQLEFSVNEVPATIRESARPVKVDVLGARNFQNAGTGNNYWVGASGITVNGVPDALKFSQLPDFQFLALWPKFGTSNGVVYDLLGFVKVNAAGGLELAYGPAAVPRVSIDGRLIYTYLGMLGTLPAAEEPVITQARQIWTEPQGFFVVTYDTTIDLVSAKDGKTWISLFRP
ncbi:MAG: DUF4302 domain-containing protein [Adhaeribacter sp.]